MALTRDTQPLDPWLAAHLVCPRDRTPLSEQPGQLTCPQGHAYPVLFSIPILLTRDIEPNFERYWSELDALLAHPPQTNEPVASGVDPYVNDKVAATNGLLYKRLWRKLARYPLPHLWLPPGQGRHLLDVGCNWGRWSLVAAQRGYQPVGIDPELDGVLAAQRVSRQLGLRGAFVVGDARCLPFASGAFDTVFSYSVLQHFSKPNARTAFREIGRVLRAGGQALVQMPNRYGVRALYYQALRPFRPRHPMEVRYWGPRELKDAFSAAIGPTELFTDAYFGLGIQASDADLMPPAARAVIGASEVLRHLSERVPALVSVADSVYARSVRAAE